MQLGAGGAGAAVAHALLNLGVGRLAVFDTDRRAPQRAADLAARFGAGRPAGPTSRGGGAADGLVNTTPVGMAKYPGMPLPAGLLRPDLWVAEIIYFPLETELLRRAASWAAGRSTAAAWRCSRRSRPSACSPASRPMPSACSATSSRWWPAETDPGTNLQGASSNDNGRHHGA